MSQLRSLHSCFRPSPSSIPGSSVAANRPLGEAKVISLDAARAVLRPRAPERRLTQQEIDDPRDRAWREFFLRNEPSFRFEDFGGRS